MADDLNPEDTEQTLPDTETHNADDAPPEPPSADNATVAETPPAESEWVSFRDAAQNAGYDLSGAEDDEAAMQLLVKEAQRAAQLQAQLDQAQAYAASLAAQQQPKDPEPETPKEPLEAQLYKAPHFDPAWLSMVRRDEDGAIVPTPGTSPEVVANLQRWVQFQQEQQDKFWRNPFEYIQPYVDQRVEDLTAQRLEQYSGTQTERQRARDIIQQNQEWMVTKADDGKTTLTPEGTVYNEAIQKMAHLNTEDQHAFGMASVERYRAIQSSKQAQAVEQHQQKKQEAVQPQREPTAGGTVQPGETQNPGLSLQEMLAKNLKEAGITDEDFVGTY